MTRSMFVEYDYQAKWIIRARDTLFDLYSFYDSCVFNLEHFLSTRVKNVIQILEMFETTFDNVLIEQNDDDSKDLIFEIFFKKIDEFITNLIDLQPDLKDFVFEKISQIITLEMTSNRNVDAMNNQVHIAVLLVSKIIKI
jgi:hypothetical protein